MRENERGAKIQSEEKRIMNSNNNKIEEKTELENEREPKSEQTN